MSENFRFWCRLIGMIVGSVAMLVLIVSLLDKSACLSKYADFQPEYRGVITGCLVQYNGKTVPAESLRVMN